MEKTIAVKPGVSAGESQRQRNTGNLNAIRTRNGAYVLLTTKRGRTWKTALYYKPLKAALIWCSNQYHDSADEAQEWLDKFYLAKVGHVAPTVVEE